jgi:tetratricopeptide (TPR) repeat protein
MSGKDPAKMRLELARMHWALGERADAVTTLERGAAAIADPESLLALVDGYLEELEAGDAPDLAARLAGLRAKAVEALEAREAPAVPAPLATPTMAKLLADQGHSEKALAVTDDLLRRNPGDARALAVRESITAQGAPAAPSAPRRTGRKNHSRAIGELERWLGNLARRKQKDALA